MSRKPWWQSIRLNVILLVLLMLIAIVLLGAAGTLYYQGVIRQNIHSDALTQAQTIAAQTPEYMNTLQLYLTSIAERPSVVKAMGENDRSFLRSTAVYANQTNRISDVYFTDSKGAIIESTPGIASLIGTNSSDHAYVSSVIMTGKPLIGDVEPIADRMPVVPIGVPVKDENGSVIGVMVGRVDLGEYEKMLVDSYVKPQQIFYMVNRTGHVMMHTNPDYAVTMSDFTAVPGVQNVLRGEAGAADYYNPIENQSRMGAFAPVEPMGWGVIVALPTDVAYQPVWNATWLAAGIIALFSLIVIGLGLYIGNGITAPITRMSQATQIAFKTEDYKRLLPLGRADEIGDLSRSFSEMVDTVKKGEHERARAEEVLRESEEKFRVLAETSKAAIYVYQGENLVYVNEAAERITGYSKDELLKMKFWDIVHPDTREIVRERGLARQRGEPVPSPYEAHFIAKGGEDRWVELSAGPIMYKGKPAGVATFFDITGRKQTEEELANAKAQAELYLDLIGHDINNLNQVAIGFLELALNSLDLNPEQKEFIEKPLESLQSSSRLIDNVRRLQKAETGGFPSRAIDLCDILDELRNRYSHMPGRKITINFKRIHPCYVIANELISDIFSNLIGNAIKHSEPDKELIINLGLEKVTIDDKDYYQVSVEDNGPGIGDELKPKLFTRFKRGETKASGKGLGLYIARTLVKDFQGKIWVEDRVPGDHTKGARFVVMLPAADRPMN